MKFFNKIKLKSQLKNLLWVVVSLAAACFFIWNIIDTGFSSEVKYKVVVIGISIPLAQWAVSCMFIVAVCVALVIASGYLVSMIKNTEFESLMQKVKELGDADTIGNMLSSIKKSPYIKKGDLRYNDKILFYQNRENVTIISQATITDIRLSITKCVCVSHDKGSIDIYTDEKKLPLLLEDMKKTLAPVSKMGTAENPYRTHTGM